MIQIIPQFILYSRILPSFIYLLESTLGIIGPYLYFRFVKKEKLSRFFYIFVGLHSIFVNVYFNIIAAFPILPFVVHLYLNACLYIHIYVQTFWRELKPKWYLYGICLPGFWYMGWATLGSFLAGPYMLFTGSLFLVGVPEYILYIFRIDYLIMNVLVFVLSLYAFYLSYCNPPFCKEHVHLDLTSHREDCGNDQVKELPSNTVVHQDQSKILRVFQFTDVHLGPFMSKQRLYSLCEKVAKDSRIDLVIITGDMETYDTELEMTGLKEALSPLKEISHKVVACLGNHDYEVYDKVLEAYSENNISLLEDQEITIPISRWSELTGRKEEIQVIGSTFSYNHEKHEQIITQLSSKFPRKSITTPRIFLIHNPSMLSCMPLNDSCDIIFSGHLHGGQIGLGRWTFVKIFYHLLKKLKREKRIFKVFPPDQGLYGRGKLRIYSHRGTGLYGYPLRLGIPSEQSLIHLYF
ncbi:hypothetical protein FDP41_002680 [Naegleria fowleri]|uniref:Calcineurin-like phosphoesterase domain-containing protein n=1 Tax=Naegleria fowleri TaxID=5763 RepID=A0A6A5BXU1_NAEFO|nr:uncharacterized protein FDP41_002680 [Naegleria fowleri]KAF0978165.1 hypothetical protein FDP41_002680 [Naegleria fowleri]CAG4712198.1 unnamed protein product [Naegleria fowleri]